LPIVGRRAVIPGVVPVGLTPDSRTPSALALGPQAAAASDVTVTRYGEALGVEVGLAGAELGSFLHRAFEVLGARPDLATALPRITGVEVTEAAVAPLGAAVAGFEVWVVRALKPTAVQREWPLLHIDAAGTVVSGTADLVVYTAAGAWIIDHKSDAVENSMAAFAKYRGQLEAYAQALEAQGVRVAGVGVNWVRRGEVVMMEIRQ
jgi:ATP-dependent exoDNAse (exonuclease V) beta subunit